MKEDMVVWCGVICGECCVVVVDVWREKWVEDVGSGRGRKWTEVKAFCFVCRRIKRTGESTSKGTESTREW